MTSEELFHFFTFFFFTSSLFFLFTFFIFFPFFNFSLFSVFSLTFSTYSKFSLFSSSLFSFFSLTFPDNSCGFSTVCPSVQCSVYSMQYSVFSVQCVVYSIKECSATVQVLFLLPFLANYNWVSRTRYEPRLSSQMYHSAAVREWLDNTLVS